MDRQATHREQVSALADGHWDSLEAGNLRALSASDSRTAWLLYHQIGDVLRSPDYAPFLDDSFDRRFRARFAAEPVFLPRQRRQRDVPALHPVPTAPPASRKAGESILPGRKIGGVVGTAVIAAAAALFFSATSLRPDDASYTAVASSGGAGKPLVIATENRLGPVLLDTPAQAVGAQPNAVDKALPSSKPEQPLTMRQPGAPVPASIIHTAATQRRPDFASSSKN